MGKPAKKLVSAVTDKSKAIVGITKEVVKAPIDLVGKVTGTEKYTEQVTDFVDKVADKSDSVMGEVKKGFNTAIDIGTSATKNVTKFIANPIKGTKNLLKNPAETITKLAGLDVLFKDVGVGQPNVQPAQGEHQQYRSEQDESASLAAGRRRMLTRQGMQGNIPTLLTGQDMQPTNLDENVELGGRGS